MDEQPTYEAVWGRVTAEGAADIRALSESTDVAIPDSAVSGAVCLLRGADGELRGLSSVRADDVPLVAGRRFWIYRSVVRGRPGEETDMLLAQTFAALDDAFDRDAGGPIGLCLVITDPAEMERRPAAEWTEPPMLFAGYAPDGSQVRIGYFTGAQI